MASMLLIHTASQGLCLAVTLACLVFFIIQRLKKRCNWEVIYVMVVQFFTYVMMIAAGDDVVRTFDDGQILIWPRYMGWILTCPVMVELVCQIAYKDPPAYIVSRYMMMTLGVLSLGVTATVFSNRGVKYTCVALSVILLLTIYGTFIYAWMSRNVLKPSRMCLILFFMISWFIFPVLFLMGPETSGMISYHTAALLHAIADIVCKSLFSLAAWHFRSVRLRELLEKQAKEAAGGTDSDEENQKGGFQRGGFNRLESPSMSRLYSVAPGKLETEMAPRSFTQAFQSQNGRSPDNVQQLVQRMHELEHRLAAAQQGGSIGSVSADISPSPSSSNLVGMASQQQSQQHVLASQSASKMQYPWEVGSDGGQQQGGGSGANTPPQTSSRPQSPTFGGQGMPSPEVLNRLAALESRLSQM